MMSRFVVHGVLGLKYTDGSTLLIQRFPKSRPREEHRMNHSTSDKNKTTNKIRIHLHSSLAASSLNVAEGPNMSYGIQVLLSREQEHVMSSSLAVRKLPIRTSTPQYK